MHTPAISSQALHMHPARLWGFLSLSLLLHALLLTGLSHTATNPALPDYGNPTVNVVIRKPSRPDTTAEPAPRARPPASFPDARKKLPAAPPPRTLTTNSRAATRTPARPARAPIREDSRQEAASLPHDPSSRAQTDDGKRPAPIRHAEAPPRPATGQPAERTSAALAKRNFILGRIEHLLGRHLVYPRLAVRRGWEGKVILSFRLLADGRIDNIAVSRSSGHAILDHAARKGLQRLRRIEDAIDWLQGRSLDLEIPVHYRLRG